jgi:DNA-binding PadR family transcriptional regulator
MAENEETPRQDAPKPGSTGDLPWEAAADAAAQLASKLAGLAGQVAEEGMKYGVKAAAHKQAKQAKRVIREDLPGAWFFGGGPPPWAGGRRRGPWGPPPGAWERKAKRGDVRAVILTLLAEEPRNGYQIIQETEERTEGTWKPSPGAVYPALQQLTDEGLIASTEENGRKTYSLTDEGRAYVSEHADELSTPWADRTAKVDGSVADLFKEAAQMGGALMQVVHAGSDEQIAQARRLVATTRRRLYGLLAEEAPASTDPEADPEEEA